MAQHQSETDIRNAIQVLPRDVAAKIAAGEVIERPTAAVKELLENALDAGANEIRVEIVQGGRRLLRVIDDGCGIPGTEVPLAFARHATSKLRSADDLEAIRTLGFRGEALASIAGVSQVTMLTRARHEALGTQIRLSAGEVTGQEARGAPAGTVITVENLFFNLPARLKFLRAPASEAAQIHQLVSRYALAYPERRFSLISDGRLLFQSTGSGKLYDVIVKVYGLDVAKDMLVVGDDGRPTMDDRENPHPSVYGFTSAPAQNRANRNYLTFFLNRRWISDRNLMAAVTQAYHSYLPNDRFPVSVLSIDVSPEFVDVNVHPAKTEVRFQDPGVVFSAVQRAVRRTLNDFAPVPTVNRPLFTPSATPPKAPDWAMFDREERQADAAGQLALELRRAEMDDGRQTADDKVQKAEGGTEGNLRELEGTRQKAELLPRNLGELGGTPGKAEGGRQRAEGVQGNAGEQGRTPEELGTEPQTVLPRMAQNEQLAARPQPSAPQTADNPVHPSSLIPHPSPSPATPQPAKRLPILRVVGQMSATYIIAEGPTGMYLIDQHAAHERILFDAWMAERRLGTVARQALLEPISMTLSPQLALAAESNQEALASVGFEVEPFGPDTILLRAIPALLTRYDPREALLEMLENLAEGKNSAEAEREAKLLRIVCKRAAIKAGQILSVAEMEALIQQLENTAHPRTCPHGRPTMIHLSATTLEREFGRT